MAESDRVLIFDTTLRDGEQAAGVAFSARDKLEIAAALAAAGVDVVEAGFPVSSRGEFEAVRGVAREVRDTRVCALARAVPKDVEAAGEALRDAAAPRMHVFVNASDMQLAHQLRRSRREVTGMVHAMVGRARELVDDVEFSPMDATRADREFVTELAEVAVRAGARTVNLPDTVGYALPDAVRELVEHVRARIAPLADAVVSFHGQDDLGLATANSLAAVAGGARQVEVALNGIGERAGNTAFEEVVMALRVHGERMGVRTGVDARAIHALSRLVAERSGIAVPPNKAVVGANAFRHASGIHQDGVLKHRATFECFDPAEIGHPEGTQIVVGKLSGRAGFAARAEALGYRLDGRALARAFERFQALAADGGVSGDGALHAACEAAAACASPSARVGTVR
jgi:2-isopropylmalate synthase